MLITNNTTPHNTLSPMFDGMTRPVDSDCSDIEFRVYFASELIQLLRSIVLAIIEFQEEIFFWRCVFLLYFPKWLPSL